MMRNATILQATMVFTALVAVTVIIAATGLDIKDTSYFYVPGSGFPYGTLEPWDSLYRYGPWPAYLLAGGALVILVAGFFRENARRHRKACAFLLVLLLVGPGLLVNTFLKDHWGRPRPRQVTEFGGQLPFHHPWQKDSLPGCKSFPSGHASAAFYLMGPYFVLRRSSRRWAYRLLFVGIGYGLLVGIARMVQGGHFMSDVLWSGGLVYLSGLVLAALMRLDCQQ